MIRCKLASELEPGDLFHMEEPPGIARVTRNYSSGSTPIEPQRPREGHSHTAVALIVCFEMTEGRSRGLKSHVFVHPTERIRIP